MDLKQQLIKEVQKDVSSHVISKIVTQLVAHLRLCDVEILQEFLKQTLQHPNQNVRCVTAACVMNIISVKGRTSQTLHIFTECF